MPTALVIFSVSTTSSNLTHQLQPKGRKKAGLAYPRAGRAPQRASVFLYRRLRTCARRDGVQAGTAWIKPTLFRLLVGFVVVVVSVREHILSLRLGEVRRRRRARRRRRRRLGGEVRQPPPPCAGAAPRGPRRGPSASRSPSSPPPGWRTRTGRTRPRSQASSSSTGRTCASPSTPGTPPCPAQGAPDGRSPTLPRLGRRGLTQDRRPLSTLSSRQCYSEDCSNISPVIEVTPGTEIVFQWSGSHNVLAMPSKAAYDSCDKAAGIDLGPSPVNYEVLARALALEDDDLEPDLYFICGVGESSSAFPRPHRPELTDGP